MENRKGLGRGLDSLLGIFDKKDEVVETKKVVSDKKVVENDNKKLDTTEIDISLIDNNVEQPRKNFDPTALKELAESIKTYGVIQPILVVPKKDRYMIVAGERRFRASKLAGLKKIPAVVREYTEQQVQEISLLENIQREDLNPIETAKAMKELLVNYGWTQEELADRLGKSRPVVANFIRLLSLCPEVIALIESGKLSAGHARSLVVVTDPEVQLKLAKDAVSKKITVRDMEKAVKELNNPKPKKAQEELSIEMKDLVRTMQRKFSTKVNVIGNNKKGRIYIDYYNSDDLDRIYDLITRL
jgi:ParB family chromosome partitioning protein